MKISATFFIMLHLELSRAITKYLFRMSAGRTMSRKKLKYIEIGQITITMQLRNTVIQCKRNNIQNLIHTDKQIKLIHAYNQTVLQTKNHVLRPTPGGK